MSKFIDDIKKVKDSREHKIKGSYGVYDAYKDIRKLQWLNIGRPLTENEFYSIIRTVNNIIAENIAIGNTIKLPYRMGTLELRKKRKIIQFVNGKVKTNALINWNETLKLWELDEYCFNKRKLIRNIDNDIYLVKWNKFNALIKNKTLFIFKLNRHIKLLIKNNINNGTITDAFLLNSYYK